MPLIQQHAVVQTVAVAYNVVLLPSYQALFPLDEGIELEFAHGGEERAVPVPIPRLPGMDEVEVSAASFRIYSQPVTRDASVAASSVGTGGLTVPFQPPAAGAPVELVGIEIEDLMPGQGLALTSEGVQPTARVSWRLDGKVKPVWGAPGPGERQLHILVLPAQAGGFGPPMAAVPHFAMPGKGGGLYGPALGGARLRLVREADDKVRAIVSFPKPMATAGFRLLIGHADETQVNRGLPNDVEGVAWSARTVRATWEVRPAGVTITAAAGAGEPAAVAQFDVDPGERPLPVDFAPVARSILRRHYPTSQGADLGLGLRVVAASPGRLRVALDEVRARYLRFPAARGELRLGLRGGGDRVELPIPSGLRPAAVSFTLDGRYGAMRLVIDADGAPAASRLGFRVAGDVAVARLVHLGTGERALPLGRVALFGRAVAACELLVALHRGAPGPGGGVGVPLSLAPAPAAEPAWHRAEWRSPDLLPPHDERLWLVVRAVRGSFWWHADPGEAAVAQRSEDEGATWAPVGGRPLAQLFVRDVDAATGEPRVREPVTLSWQDGLLDADLVGIPPEGFAPADFRRHWLAEGEADRALLERVAALDGRLSFGFDCRRDVDLTLSQAALAYNPWAVGAT
jgi:hypothetical protein